MRLIIRLVLAAMVAVIGSASAHALDTMWFSQSNVDPGVAPPGGVSTFTYNSFGPQTLYVWVTDGTEVSPSVVPPAGWVALFPNLQFSSAGFSYNLAVTG